MGAALHGPSAQNGLTHLPLTHGTGVQSRVPVRPRKGRASWCCGGAAWTTVATTAPSPRPWPCPRMGHEVKRMSWGHSSRAPWVSVLPSTFQSRLPPAEQRQVGDTFPLGMLRLSAGGSLLPSQRRSLEQEKAMGASQEHSATPAAQGSIQPSPGQQPNGQAPAGGCLPHPHPRLPQWLPLLKFIGTITYEKSVPSEGGWGWGWAADCNLMIRLKYAKANK